MARPGGLARAKYSQSMGSQIFDPEERSSARHFVPAGKRRDQTTREMFGDGESKGLQAMPKTFVPKDDLRSARLMKQDFLHSDVLPHTVYPAGVNPGPSANRFRVGMPAFGAEEPGCGE